MMRTRFLLSSALVLLAAAPAAMRAQFQPPNPDELKMTTDPKAPGADAVILDNEETDSDQAHAILATKCTPGEGQVQVVYSIVRGFALAQADEYQDLRGFYQKVAATDQEQLVLASAGTTVGKGN
jgi:hypothetical protein